MQTKSLGQDVMFYQEYTAKAGDTLELCWQGGEKPQHMTIVSKTAFEQGKWGGPGASDKDAASARWQVPNDGAWLVIAVAPNPLGNFSANTLLKAGQPVQVYGLNQLSYGDLDAPTAQKLIAEVLQLANQRRKDVTSREPSPDENKPDPAACGTDLLLDERLNCAAQSHCMNMARQDFSGHDGKDGSTPATRIGVAGFAATLTGEIITYGRSTPAEAIRSWMESVLGHRGNLLNCQWTHTGIGLYYRADDPGENRYRYYWTMVFAVAR